MKTARIPGKLFLMGEYAVLDGGRAMLAALQEPYVYQTKTAGGAPQTFHPQSPVGQYFTQNPGLHFSCVHFGLGAGFGSSTAELIAASQFDSEKTTTPAALWSWYKKHFPNASGADLITQIEALHQNHGLFEVQEGQASKIKPSKILSQVYLFQVDASRKLPTHIDLDKPRAKIDFAFSNQCIDRFQRALETETLAELKVLNEWADYLHSLELETERAFEIRKAFSRIPEVVGVKGCGAGLNDVFMVAVRSFSAAQESLNQMAQQFQLKALGDLNSRLWGTYSATAFAPVNIAWIKYMGKENGNPTNFSFSMTLENIGTRTRIQVLPATEKSSTLKVVWNESGYVPPEKGQKKAENFLKNEPLFRQAMQSVGFECFYPENGSTVEIFTENNVPAGTGIATSASAFAALTAAWFAVLAGPEKQKWLKQAKNFRSLMAEVAKHGSGSACRSFDGPWVEWGTGIKNISGGKTRFIDFILLIDEEEKKVSSSEAHLRVASSPLFKGRVERVNQRLAIVQQALKTDDLQTLQIIVLEEALDMHELFHTATPSFSYLKPLSEEWIELVKTQSTRLPSQKVILTLDAGANVHLFVPEEDEKLWQKFLAGSYPDLKYVLGRAGEGARYV